MIPEPIREAKDFELPDEVAAVLASVTEAGAKLFADQILSALRDAAAKGDFRPVQDVIDSWYRSLLFAGTTSQAEEEDLQRDVEEILAGGRDGQSLHELRRELSLPNT